MKRYNRYLFTCLLLCGKALYAQTPDDNVLVTRCEENYTFMEQEGVPVVRHSSKTSYVASRMAAIIQPHVYYGEFISLDGASAKGSSKAQYKSITPENVFFDDTKVCFFDIHLDRKGKTTEVKFKRTFSDLRYFTYIPLAESYFTQEKQVTFVIPASLSRYRLVERNFTPDIRCEREMNAQGDSVITYYLQNGPALKEEEQMPPANRLYPYLLVTGAFEDYQALYRWFTEMAQVDCHVPDLDKLTAEITQGCTTDGERIRATYAWVQQHIRYIAFEAGISGHRPDTPAEVLRKRYGDCKGMALLLRTLLRAQGFDARLADIGTDDVPCSMTETPTLAAANHVICTLFHDGKTYFLDATCEYIPLGYVPQHLQGQKALIEAGETCAVYELPRMGSDTATDSLHYACTVSPTEAGKVLSGTVTRCWSGDMKESFLTLCHGQEAKEREQLLLRALTSRDHNCRVAKAAWEEQSSQQPYAVLTGNLENQSAVQAIGSEIYVELNIDNGLFGQPVDTMKRVHAYCLPVRCRVVREVELQLPAGYSVMHCPAGICLETAQGTLACTFRIDEAHRKVIFRKVMEITERQIAREYIPEWNEALRQWHEAGREQVVLKSGMK